MRRLLVTGLSGFAGRTLSAMGEALSASGREIVAPGTRVDVGDRAALNAFVAGARADEVIHLAARTYVPDSFRDPAATFQVNFLGTLNLLAALEAAGFRGRMLYVGSSDCYGRVPDEMLPVTENVPLRPRNPYAVSKVAAEALCYQWSQSGPFQIVMARPFNHIGPGQSERFVVSSLAKQLVEIGRGVRAPALRVGDLDASRDFTDARDVVRAYLGLLDAGVPGEIYNVCSGEEHRIRELLDIMLGVCGLDVKVEVDSGRMRPSEQRRVVGSPRKIIEATGWRPRIPVAQSLRDVLTYWEQGSSGG